MVLRLERPAAGRHASRWAATVMRPWRRRDDHPLYRLEGSMARPIVSRRAFLAGLGGAAALALAPTSGGVAAAPRPDAGADPAVVADWQATAVATILADAGKANAEARLWF